MRERGHLSVIWVVRMLHVHLSLYVHENIIRIIIQVIHKESSMVTNVPITEHGTPLTAGDRGVADPRYAETVYTPGRIVHPHWGAIIAGLFVTLSTLALLS